MSVLLKSDIRRGGGIAQYMTAPGNCNKVEENLSILRNI